MPFQKYLLYFGHYQDSMHATDITFKARNQAEAERKAQKFMHESDIGGWFSVELVKELKPVTVKD